MTSSKLDANEWNTIEPYYAALLAEELRPETIQSWLHRWSDLDKQVWEARAWHKRAKARDATDVVAQAAWQRFTTTVFLPFQAITQQLKNKLLAFQHWQPAPDQQQFLRRLKSEASFSSLENTSIEAGIAELQGTYFKIIGGLTIPLDDQELTVAHAELHLLNIDRL
jgi:hypothetical protein